jgi:epoxyqueuosine reductase QueG
MKEFKKNLMYNLNHKEIQSMSNREFKRKYGNRAFSWRGKKVILRNFEVLNLKN